MRGIAMIGLLLALATSACTKLAPSPATDARRAGASASTGIAAS